MPFARVIYVIHVGWLVEHALRAPVTRYLLIPSMVQSRCVRVIFFIWDLLASWAMVRDCIRAEAEAMGDPRG